MTAVEGDLGEGSQFSARKYPKQEQEPASEEIFEIAPNILRLQLPISMPGLGHVNTYCIISNDRVVLVDPGLPSKASYKALRSRLKQAGLSLEKVRGVVVTHSHPDHYGGVRRLIEDSGAQMIAQRDFGRLVMAPGVHECGADLDTVHDHNHQHREQFRGIENAFYVENFDRETWNGPVWLLPRPWNSKPLPPPISKAKIAAMKVGWRTYLKRILPPIPDMFLEDGQELELAGGGMLWRAIHTPGHTLDHLCLYQPDLGLLISGDHVLPTITPHIPGVGGGPDSLAGFLGSLTKLESLGEVTKVLPAHGHPFDDLESRISTIVAHHDSRIVKIRKALDESGPMRVEDVSKVLFRPQRLGPMADSEAFAHLEHMRLAGQVSHRVVNGEFVYELVG